MRSDFEAIVVGSGPSGISCAYTLIKRGWRVGLLDYGKTSSEAKTCSLDPYLTNRNRVQWIENGIFDHGKIQNSRKSSSEKVKKEYFFADVDKFIIRDVKNASVNMSLSLGGLSNIWSGAVLPATEADTKDWPISIKALKPYYKVIDEFMPISSELDDLDLLFNLNHKGRYRTPLGRQAQDLRMHLQERQGELGNEGIYFGRSRLAIDSSSPVENEENCIGPLFNSANVLSKLEQSEKFQYVSDLFVDHIDTNDTYVEIQCYSVKGKSTVRFRCGKIFLACGAISTTLLLAKSFKKNRSCYQLATNQTVFIPFIRNVRSRGISRVTGSDFPELFLEINNSKTKDKFIHCQVYQYGDYVLESIRRSIGANATRIFKIMSRPILERVMVLQCFFHSDYSDTLLLEMLRGDDAGRVKASVQGVNNPDTTSLGNDLFRLMFNKRKALGGIPLKQFSVFYPPGGSSHIGSSFPMSKRPNENESDLLGRVMGTQNIHVVDSTILPSLPATTLTYTVMANAARIAASV